MPNITNTSIVGFAIVAILEGIKRYVPQVNGGITIILAALLGGYAGLLGIEGLTPITGIYTGLAAVGVHTVASTVNTTP